MNEISQDKLDWLEEIGATRLHEPIMYDGHTGKKIAKPFTWRLKDGGWYSDEYISETPLDVLVGRYIARTTPKEEAVNFVQGVTMSDNIERININNRLAEIERKLLIKLETSVDDAIKQHKRKKRGLLGLFK